MSKFNIDYSKLPIDLVKQIPRLVNDFKNKDIRKKDLLLFKEIIDLLNSQKEEQYNLTEKSRRDKIKKGDFVTDEEVDMFEKNHIEILISNLIKYRDKKRYIDEQRCYINKKFLDRLLKLFELDNGGFIDKPVSYIKQYKDVLDLFIERIDIKDKERFKKGEIIKNQNVLFFLHLNRYMK